MSSRRAPTRFRRDLLAWGERNRRSFGWRASDDPFRVLVAEVLLQRSRGSTVGVVYDELFTRWPDAAALADADTDAIASRDPALSNKQFVRFLFIDCTPRALAARERRG